MGLHAYLNEENLLHVALCQDPSLPASAASSVAATGATPDEGWLPAWPNLMVAGNSDVSALARGVVAEVMEQKDAPMSMRAG